MSNESISKKVKAKDINKKEIAKENSFELKRKLFDFVYGKTKIFEDVRITGTVKM